MNPKSIIIDGTRQVRDDKKLRAERYLVLIDRQQVFLQAVGFRFFSIFGIQLLIGKNEGWICASDLYRQSEIVSGYIYRMKQTIYCVVPHLQSWPIIENDRQGRYRLIAEPGGIAVNYEKIYEFGDFDLTQMVDRLIMLNRKILK